jgi:hypothetical protein
MELLHETLLVKQVRHLAKMELGCVCEIERIIERWETASIRNNLVPRID